MIISNALKKKTCSSANQVFEFLHWRLLDMLECMLTFSQSHKTPGGHHLISEGFNLSRASRHYWSSIWNTGLLATKKYFAQHRRWAKQKCSRTFNMRFGCRVSTLLHPIHGGPLLLIPGRFCHPTLSAQCYILAETILCTNIKSDMVMR